MAKTLSAETAASHVIESMKPVLEIDSAANAKSSAQPPTKTPLPAPLERALGINQPRSVPK